MNVKDAKITIDGRDVSADICGVSFGSPGSTGAVYPNAGFSETTSVEIPIAGPFRVLYKGQDIGQAELVHGPSGELLSVRLSE
jgi:hypothetical protein